MELTLNPPNRLSHTDARILIRRAIDKTEQLKNAGAFVAVDQSGAPVSASRMDGVGPFAIPLVRAKAHCAGSLYEPSAQVFDRMAPRSLGLYLGYRDVARDNFFMGQGAIPIDQGGVIVGALATGAGVGPFVKFDGVEPEQLISDGNPTNLEDLVICYALGVPYAPQHGDDAERWLTAYGKPASSFGEGRAYEDPAPASAQLILDNAVKLADGAVHEAQTRDRKVSVVVTDRSGDLIQMDRMDDASPMTADIAQALAVTAVNSQCPSGSAADAYAARDAFEKLGDVVPYNLLAIPGGVPIFNGATLIGAIGVAGLDPKASEDVASAAIAAMDG